jgi:methionyl-tRNA formyltransferase
MTVFKMNEELDAGDIILQREVVLDPKESLEDLITRTKIANAQLILDAIRLYKNGVPKMIPNDESQATYFSFPTKDDVKRFREKGLKLV